MNWRFCPPLLIETQLRSCRFYEARIFFENLPGPLCVFKSCGRRVPGIGTAGGFGCGGRGRCAPESFTAAPRADCVLLWPGPVPQLPGPDPGGFGPSGHPLQGSGTGVPHRSCRRIRAPGIPDAPRSGPCISAAGCRCTPQISGGMCRPPADAGGRKGLRAGRPAERITQAAIIHPEQKPSGERLPAGAYSRREKGPARNRRMALHGTSPPFVLLENGCFMGSCCVRSSNWTQGQWARFYAAEKNFPNRAAI